MVVSSLNAKAQRSTATTNFEKHKNGDNEQLFTLYNMQYVCDSMLLLIYTRILKISIKNLRDLGMSKKA